MPGRSKVNHERLAGGNRDPMKDLGVFLYSVDIYLGEEILV